MTLGKAFFTVLYCETLDELTTEVLFEDRQSEIYYCWTVHNKSGQLLGGKCLPISKRIIPTDKNQIDFAIEHATFSINNFKINRKLIFKVLKVDKT